MSHFLTFSRICNLALLVTASVLFTGCGNGLASLEGTVMVDGEPGWAGIALQFQPTGKGSPSYGQTDDNGRFVAQFTHRKSGIQPGEIRVSLVPGGGDEKMPGSPEEKKAAEKRKKGKLPRRYFTEIETITVKDGANDIVIELTTE